MNIFVLFILGYLLYRFIGGFLIPLFRTTRHMHQQFQNMNKQPGQDGRSPNQGSHASEGFGGQNGQRPTANGQPKSPNPTGSKIGEYIDFEEVK
jgi:hypothetical protein